MGLVLLYYICMIPILSQMFLQFSQMVPIDHRVSPEHFSHFSEGKISRHFLTPRQADSSRLAEAVVDHLTFRCGKSFSGDGYLVGGFNPSEKYESQLGLLFPYIMENKTMFETTNQIIGPY